MDGEYPTVYSEATRKARKEHTCYECGSSIYIGVEHMVAEGLWDGKWKRFRWCLKCEELRQKILSISSDDEIPAFGDLHEWAEEEGLLVREVK